MNAESPSFAPGRHMRLGFALWLVVAGIAGSPTPCVADTLVTLHQDGQLTRPTVKLSDLFNGVPAEIDRDIAQAPAPGKQAVYDAGVLTKLAEKYRLEWQAKSVADHVAITSACTRITGDDIRAAIARKMHDAGTTGAIDVAFDNRALEIDLPANLPADFELGSFDYDALSKRFRADLMAEGANGPFALPIGGRITVKRHVPVLARALEAGTVIGAADIDWIDVPEERAGTTAITDAAQLTGHELRHTTGENEVLHAGDVMSPRLVTRGSLVTMKIEAPGMVLTARGKALQDGTEGETVRVVNTQSNRMLEGTVSGPNTVTITTAQHLASVEGGT